MNIEGLIWLEDVIEKIERKHNVSQKEVREAFYRRPYFVFVERGHRQGENVYAAMGQTGAGRYIIVFFVYKRDKRALILTARNVTHAERKRYEQR